MIDVNSLTFEDLLPSSIKDDQAIKALTTALDKEMQLVTQAANEIILLPNINNLSEELVDFLAWQFHVDFYEPLGLDLNKKRALVKNSFSWHRRKGTKSVLEEIIRILFLEDFKIEEWFEYAGEPYFFRLIINDVIGSRQEYKDLVRAVFELKNVRSWLEKIKFQQELDINIYAGVVVKHVSKSTMSADVRYNDTANLKFYIGVTVRHVRKSSMSADMQYNNTANLQLHTGVAIRHVRRSIIQCRMPDEGCD